MIKRKKLKSLKKLKQQADKVFSLWVRQREKSCYTCGSRKKLQAGHYISRSYLSLRYSEINVHTQCVSCNVFKNGNLPVYALRLLNQYGSDILKELDLLKRAMIVFPRKLYTQVIEKYGLSRN